MNNVTTALIHFLEDTLVRWQIEARLNRLVCCLARARFRSDQRRSRSLACATEVQPKS